MIQITGIRPKPSDPSKKIDYAFFDEGWRAPSIQELFTNLQSYIDEIPLEHRWNLYFTVANCSAKKRDFESQSALAFDIDGIDVARVDDYVRIFCERMGVRKDEIGIVFSGNGLHFYIGLQVPIVAKEFFDQNRDHYKAIRHILDKAMGEAGLPGETDPAVFDARRLMRLPGTENHKRDKGRADSKCYLINGTILPSLFDITLMSGIPRVKAEDQLDKDYFRKFPKTDNEAVLAGCNFIKECKASPGKINEPQWYAMLSITSRMEDGARISHEISKGHKGYSERETDLKIEQSISASGPRTCKSIDNVWGKCKSCPNFNKINSPIMLRGPDSITTEHTGFHDIVFDPETNKPKRGKPNFLDLKKFFEREVGHFKIQAGSCYVWNKTHYEIRGEHILANFAQKHFNPTCNNNMAKEFIGIMQRFNYADDEFWKDTTQNKVNFRNGMLDLRTLELSPHDREVGFRYVLPYFYDKHATCPTFEKFLADVTDGDEALQTILKEYAGYALSGDAMWAHKLLVLTGDGRNGKSTFMKVLKAIVGRKAYTAMNLSQLKAPDRRAALDGALFNICEEAPQNMGDSADIKAIVGGDEIMARRLYCEPYQFVNRAKMIFLCNGLPRSSDTSYGFYSRLCIVPFEQVYNPDNPKFDPYIEHKLLAELPGIFNLFIAAYRNLKERQHFVDAAVSLEHLDHYKQENDALQSWIVERVKVEKPDHASRKTLEDLFKSYRTYAEAAGFVIRDLLNYPTFQKRIKKVIPQYAERRIKSGDTRYITGIVCDVTLENFSQGNY